MRCQRRQNRGWWEERRRKFLRTELLTDVTRHSPHGRVALKDLRAGRAAIQDRAKTERQGVRLCVILLRSRYREHNALAHYSRRTKTWFAGDALPAPTP